MAFQQGLSGLNTSSKALDVTSNNIANASTVGFKSASTHFADVYAASLAGGRSISGRHWIFGQRHCSAIYPRQHYDHQ